MMIRLWNITERNIPVRLRCRDTKVWERWTRSSSGRQRWIRKHRMLKLVEIEDARMASSVTEMLMGTEVPPRRSFIYKNATEAELDI